MLYRKLGKTGLNVSILGFGAMRLPVKNLIPNSQGNGSNPFDPNIAVDEEETQRMIDYSIENGVNYFDTAYLYHNWKSENILGRALKNRRDKVIIATKLPVMFAQNKDDIEKYLDEQLVKLNTDYIDVYLLHGLNKDSWEKAKEFGAPEFLEKAKSDGRVRHVGFSFHDNLNVFKEIIDSYNWEIAQIQYNYFDENNQAGKKGLLYAASKGLAVVIMEPLRGGKLANPIPPEVQAIWDSSEVKRTPAAWGLQWVWNHPEVSVVLSGMSTMEQVKENIKLADKGHPESLSDKEFSTIRKAKEAYEKMIKVGCTGCEYCMPCKAGVNIPNNFSMYNDIFVFKDNIESVIMNYNLFTPPDKRASNCIECGECEEICPQHIQIRDELKNVHKALYREEMNKNTNL